eukprot:EG_transcript_41034
MENRLWKKNATGDALCISRTVNMSNGIYPPSALSPAKLKLLGPTRTPKNNSGPANHHKKIASTDSDSLESHFMWYIQTLAFSYGFYCVFACPCLLLHTSESQRSWLQINGEPTVIKDYAAERFQ